MWGRSPTCGWPLASLRKSAGRGPAAEHGSAPLELALVVCLLAILSAGAVHWFLQQGALLHYGDAAAHLNIARRMVDSRTPGFAQIGTVWLPLPHLLMVPFVGSDSLWRSGLAGAVPSAVCFVIAGAFLFASVRRLAESRLLAATSLALFTLNPNVLYLQSIPMTESIWFACLFALVYFTVRYRTSQSALCAAAAGVAATAGALTRYEAWFLIPFVTLYFLIASKHNRFRHAFVFGAIASLGPLYWLAHNYWYYLDALEFYHGPWSAKAIYERSLAKGMQRYRGDGELGNAALYFWAASHLCAGLGLAVLAAGGLVVSLWKRLWWPLFLLALPPAFYIWSVYSSGTPIFVPDLWPNAWYNTRYGLAAIPLLVIAASSLLWVVPRRFRWAAAPLALAIATAPWLLGEPDESWICWKEAHVNSEHRRAWTREAASYLREHYRGGGVMSSFGDLTGIFLEAGIPLRETLHSGNAPYWLAGIVRPQHFLLSEWAVTFSGDEVATAILRAEKDGLRYHRVKMIAIRGAPVIEIYKRNP